jgi:hypothetical protein
VAPTAATVIASDGQWLAGLIIACGGHIGDDRVAISAMSLSVMSLLVTMLSVTTLLVMTPDQRRGPVRAIRWTDGNGIANKAVANRAVTRPVVADPAIPQPAVAAVTLVSAR